MLMLHASFSPVQWLEGHNATADHLSTLFHMARKKPHWTNFKGCFSLHKVLLRLLATVQGVMPSCCTPSHEKHVIEMHLLTNSATVRCLASAVRGAAEEYLSGGREKIRSSLCPADV